VTVFDTANVYGSGASERILGKALRDRRDGITIATKAGYDFRPRSRLEQSGRRIVKSMLDTAHSFGNRSARDEAQPLARASGSYSNQDFTPIALRSALEASLRRLRTDHVDVLQLHDPPAVMPELLGALDDLRSSGKVGRFGIGAQSVADAAAWSQQHGVGVVQLPFGVLDPEAATDILPFAGSRGVDVWARGVLGGGLLASDRRGGHAKHSLVSGLRDISERAGIPIDELAIGFVRAHPTVSVVVLGIGSEAHLMRNVALTSGPSLDETVLAQPQVLVRNAAC
jgi:D-threo-aldose 1-dehydrogenase